MYSLAEGVGTGVELLPPPPPVIARTIVLIANPRAVRREKIVMPCSRNSLLIRSARVLSPVRIRLIVSYSIYL